MRVGVLASGAGTNLQAILDRVHGRDGVEVVGVASDKPDAQALERARGAGVAAEVFERGAFADRPARVLAIAEWLEGLGDVLVVNVPSFSGRTAVEDGSTLLAKVTLDETGEPATGTFVLTRVAGS